MGITEQFLKFALLGAEWVMYLLVLCSVLSFTVIIERIVYFMKMRGDFGTFVKELTERLNSADPLDKTAAWCAGHKMLEANVAAVGLERFKDGHKAMEDTMNATIIAARTKLDKGLTLLGTLGNNTPFIGLFGTVIGIIQAFHALSSNNASGPEVVMASISEALVATAVGLMVAIPAVIAFNVLARAVKTKMANSETVARIVLSFQSRSNAN
ncbi:MotA/TolQ/ExbB proton channel family protein [bacterium]|nr:MotA/TolQ/ExbB proton channel family protein [bacterium]